MCEEFFDKFSVLITVTPLEVALFDADTAANVFSRLCMKQDAYQEFTYYTISIRKEMLQKPVARQ